MSLLLNFLVLVCCFSSLHGAEKKNQLDWWQTEVIYQIYPRSFKDGNADGTGDLKGIIQKLPYLKKLGVGCLWLSPVLKSPMADFGYDVSNFREIDPIFGTMDDFDRFLHKAHAMGFKVIMDYVPNHTSDEHEWFTKSVQRIPPYTDYYVWKDAKYIRGKRHPPNNWISRFGKSAWEWNEERGQYYLHQFTVKQPDINYRNPVVFEEMKNNIIFWLSKGIDGLRVDSVNFLVEDERLLDEPLSNDPFALSDEYEYLNHIYTLDQPGGVKIVKEWRKIFDKYSTKEHPKVMLTEAYSNAKHMASYYGSDAEPGAQLPFNFLLITHVNRESNAYDFRDTILSWYTNSPPGSWANWVIGNHDNPRPATRFGHFLVDGLHMLQMLLPGTAVVYYGDELGMEDALIRWDETKDPKAINAGKLRYHLASRDGCRTPMQWDDTINAGFTTVLKPWLPVNPGYFKVNIKNELLWHPYGNITHLNIFRDLVKLRRNIVFQRGDMDIYVLSEWVLALVRSYPDHATFVVVVNLGSEITISNLIDFRPSLPEYMSVAVPSVNSNHKHGEIISTRQVLLRPKASVVLTTSEEEVENSIVHNK
ncbi:maltase 2-like [Planococcus citri]|uniref:maltase 2-like n=1 Tax=Planococcus citri TaxID=170843 RepID=UPI0031F9FADF